MLSFLHTYFPIHWKCTDQWPQSWTTWKKSPSTISSTFIFNDTTAEFKWLQFNQWIIAALWSLFKTSDMKTKFAALKVKNVYFYWPDGGLHLAVVQLVIVELSKEREEHLDSPDGVDGAVDGVAHRGLHVLPGPNDTRHIFVKMPPWIIELRRASRDGLRRGRTCSMRACGECTKMEAFSLGEDSRQSCASVALALYVKAMALASLPSYSTCLWCSAR